MTSTTGVKRNIRYDYPTKRNSSALNDGVLLEMESRGGGFPVQQHYLRSLIANHAIDAFGQAPDAWDEFHAVGVSVLAPERTLFEKLALLHDAASRFPDEHARMQLLRGGRHVYDVHMLLNSGGMDASLGKLGRDGVVDLCRDIDEHSEQAGFSFTARPELGYGFSPLLEQDSPVREAISQGYAGAMNLVYGVKPSLEDCLESIRVNATLL